MRSWLSSLQNVLVRVWAPNSFVLVDHELGRDLLFVDEVNRDLGFAMGERAELLVLALAQIVRVFLAKFAFVAAWVIQLLNFIMSAGTAIAQRTDLVVFA